VPYDSYQHTENTEHLKDALLIVYSNMMDFFFDPLNSMSQYSIPVNQVKEYLANPDAFAVAAPVSDAAPAATAAPVEEKEEEKEESDDDMVSNIFGFFFWYETDDLLGLWSFRLNVAHVCTVV